MIYRYIIVLILTIGSFLLLFTESGRKKMGWLLFNLIAGALDFVPPLLKEFAPALQATEQAIVSAVKANGGAIAGDLAPAFQQLAKSILDAQRGALAPAGLSTPDNAIDTAAQAFTAAFGAALASSGTAALFEAIFPEKLNVLNGLAPIMEKMAGSEEVAAEVIGPLYRAAFGQSLEYFYNQRFKPELPTDGAAVGWHAQRLITDAQLEAILKYSALKPEWEGAMTSAAYRGLNPRQLLRLIETGLFTQDDITDELNFSGMRDVSQHRMQLAAPYLATASQRSSARSALEASYVAGLLTDDQLREQSAALEQNMDREDLVLMRAQLQKSLAIAKDLEAEYTTMFIGGLIDDQTYRSYLSGIGLTPDVVNAIAAKAEARANATLQKKTIAAAAALERTTAAEERKAAMKNYTSGNINAAELAIALVATGLTSTQAAAWVDLAALQKAGGLRWQYGLQLPPAGAAQLRARVSALTDQRKRLLISAAQFSDALKALGLSDTWINALAAAANAMVTPKASATVVPVQTS